MGCASSTPMIASAGGEMLKAATHVADDAAQTAEQAVQGAAQTVGDTVHKTLDTAKETVGTAVTGIAHDLEAVYVEKSEALDEAKNNLLQKLHLGGNTAKEAAEAATEEDHSHVATPTHAAVAAAAAAASSVATTVATHDADSLKTTTPEPEIEHVLAKYNEEKPPTPVPTLAELEALHDGTTSTAAVTVATAAPSEVATNVGGIVAAEVGGGDIEQLRPNTTEWEQYADTLSRARRLRPHEVYGRKTKIPATGVTTGGPISLRRFGPLSGAPPPPPPPPPWPSKSKPKEVTHHKHLFEDDSSWSDLNYNNSSTLGSSSLSGGLRGRRGRLPYPLPRPKYALTRRHQRDFTSLLHGNGFVGGGGHGGGFMRGAGGGGFGRGWRTDPLIHPEALQLPGRKFDYNPSRIRLSNSTLPFHGNNLAVTTPPLVRRLSQPGLYGRMSPSLLPLRESTRNRGAYVRGRLGSPMAYNTKAMSRSMNASPIRSRMLMQNKVHAARQHDRLHLSDESSSVELGLPGLGHGPFSARSSRSSTSIAMRSGRSSPGLLASPMATNSVNSMSTTALTTGIPGAPPPSLDSRNSQAASLASHNKHDAGAIKEALSYYTTMHGRRYHQRRSPSPRPLPLSAANSRQPLPISPVQRSASSCRIKPPSTPLSPLFSISRQSFHDDELHNTADKENNYSNAQSKALFVTDLSSVSEHRALLSPYKLRDRCEVCHKKYVIK